MPWYKHPASLAYKIYKIYTDTVELFLRPKISDLFDDGRRKARADLLRDLHNFLNEVYALEKDNEDF